MKRWLKVGVALLLAWMLVGTVSGCGGGEGVDVKVEATVEGFLEALANLDAEEAASYVVPELRDVMREALEEQFLAAVQEGVQSISISNLRMSTSPCVEDPKNEDLASVSALFDTLDLYRDGSSEQVWNATSFTVEKMNGDWLICDIPVWAVR